MSVVFSAFPSCLTTSQTLSISIHKACGPVRKSKELESHKVILKERDWKVPTASLIG